MRLRFIGEGATCEVFGHVFAQGEWTEDPGFSESEVERLAGNPTFEVGEGEAEPAAAPPAPDGAGQAA